MPKVSFNGATVVPLDSLSGLYKNIVNYITYFYGYIKLRILFYLKTFNKDIYIYGHAQTPFSFMFFENENVFIIEDGLLNYVPDIQETHKINPIIDKFLHLCGIYFLNAKEAIGSHKNVKKVYLTQENNHPLIKDKVQVINIEELWNSFNNNEKAKILSLFNINQDITDSIDKESVLILTQPLSEDNLLTEDEEISIYHEIIDKFKDYKVVLKPHPRSEMDLGKFFPELDIIDKSFPIELLDLIGVRPKIVASVVSTALLNFKDSKIYVYNGKLNNERLINSRENLKRLIAKNNLETIN